MGVGHVMQCNAGRVRDEMLGVGPGLSGCRDGFRTEPGMSLNSIPPSRPHLEAWEGWSVPIPQHLVLRNKRQCRGGANQDSDMPSTAELMAAIAAANDSLADLIQQQAQAKEREEQEAKDATVGSFRLGIGIWLTSGLPGSQSCQCAEAVGAESTAPYQGKPGLLGSI